MTTMEETIASFLAVEPRSASLNDIQLGEDLLALLPEENLETKVGLLQKLGSLYIDNQEQEPENAIEAARDCYNEVLAIAQARKQMQWQLAAASGLAYVLVKKSGLTGSAKDFEKAETVFSELIENCDRLGFTQEAISNRMNYAKLLTETRQGDRFTHLDKAIAQLRQVRLLIDPRVDPGRYARVLYNLGAVLLQQNEEPHLRNIYFNEAVDCFLEALPYRPADRDPPGRARILRTLANVLPEWEGADSLEHAEDLASAALAEAQALEAGKVVPKNAIWTTIKQKQSALYWDLDELQLQRADIQSAIEDHEETIRQIPKDKLPLLWAQWLGGIAKLIARIAILDNDRNLIEKASAAFMNAIEAFPESSDPGLQLMLFRELGRLQHESGNWKGSLFANGKTVEIGLGLADIAGTDISRTNELEQFTRAIHFAAYAAAQLNEYSQAVEFAELGRARWLDEAIRLASVRMSSLPPEFKTRVDEAQAALLELERREHELQDQGMGGAARRLENYLGIPVGGFLKMRMTADPNGVEEKIRRELSEVRQQLQQTHESLNRLLNSTAGSDVVPARLKAGQVIALSKEAGFPILYLLTSAWGSTAIIAGEKNAILQIPLLTRGMIQHLMKGNIGYIQHITHAGDDLEPPLEAIQQLLDEHLFPIIRAWCMENNFDSIAIVGLGDIGLLPLQVSAIPAGLTLRLLPSARSLLLSLAAPKQPAPPTIKLLTIGGVNSNDMPVLEFSGIESGLFARAFERNGAVVSDSPDHATQAELEVQISSSTHVLFSCHGSFKSFSPLTSTIHLEGDEVLPVASLLRPALKLIGAELVILSACNSASTAFWRTPDEAIGFPAAFLAAGAKTVIAAQWPVDDAATLLLMQQFCSELWKNKLNAARSLANAQRWLRKATKEDIERALAAIRDQLAQEERRSIRLLDELRNEIASLEEAYPYGDRKFWAAFVCVGA